MKVGKEMNYRKKPIIVDAEQWLPGEKNWPGKDVQDDLGVYWCFDVNGRVSHGTVITIHGQETEVAIGDWVIREPDGIHYYPCKPDIFEQTYERVKQ